MITEAVVDGAHAKTHHGYSSFTAVAQIVDQLQGFCAPRWRGAGHVISELFRIHSGKYGKAIVVPQPGDRLLDKRQAGSRDNGDLWKRRKIRFVKIGI